MSTDEPERAENPRSHADTAFDASLARAQLAQVVANLCGCGVRTDACKIHRNESEESHE